MVEQVQPLPAGFRRCGECDTVRREEQFRTPHAGFKRCLFCWVRRFVAHDTTLEAFGMEPAHTHPDDASLEELGYLPEYASIELCGTCLGTFDPTGASFYVLSGCRCNPPPLAPARFPRIGLCTCCTAKIVMTQSRYSSYFCDSCDSDARTFNEWCGGTVIPRGSHSVHSADAWEAGRRLDDEELEEYVNRLYEAVTEMSSDIDEVWAHRDALIRGVAEPAGLTPGTTMPLERFLRLHTGMKPVLWCMFAFGKLSGTFIERILA